MFIDMYRDRVNQKLFIHQMHRKVLDKGKPDDVIPGIKNRKVRSPFSCGAGERERGEGGGWMLPYIGWVNGNMLPKGIWLLWLSQGAFPLTF